LFFWTFGEMLTCVLVYLCNEDWQLMCIYCMGIPLCLMIALFHYMWESPKWLVSKGYYKSAKKLIQMIADANGREIAVDYEFMEQHDANALKKDDSDINQHSVSLGYGTLFKYPSLRTVTIGGSFIYFSIQFVYYGAIFAIGSVAGSLYLNTFLLGLSEFLGYVASVPMVRFMKRKVSFSSTFILAGISSLAFLLVSIPSNCSDADESCFAKDVQIILAMITRFMISIGFLIIYLYLNELYPTSVRGIGTGFCTFIGRLGSIFAPIVVSAMESSGVNPWISFGVVSMLAGAVCTVMRETLGMPLENEIKEVRDQKESVSTVKLDASIGEPASAESK